MPTHLAAAKLEASLEIPGNKDKPCTLPITNALTKFHLEPNLFLQNFRDARTADVTKKPIHKGNQPVPTFSNKKYHATVETSVTKPRRNIFHKIFLLRTGCKSIKNQLFENT